MTTRPYSPSPGLSLTKIFSLAVSGLALLFLIFSAGSIVENVDADEILVVQDRFDGELHCYDTAGVKPQWFGQVTTYLKRDIYEISEARIRFNDAGHAAMHGSIQFDMPTCGPHIMSLHQKYGSQNAIKDQVIKRTVDKVIYMTGPLMSSRESYAEKRTDLINYVQDQIDNGIYRVAQRTIRDTDVLTGQERTQQVAEVAIVNGNPARQERSIVGEFGIRAFNFAIAELKYDAQVEAQIQQQQKITMSVQTAIAEARQAEQRKLTVEQQGAADAAKARWDQEVIKAREVTAAEGRLAVQKLANQEAEEYRQATLKRADAESKARKMMMEADNALEMRLNAQVEIAKANAQAIENIKVPIVPTTVFGSGANGNSAATLLDLMTIQAAKQVGLGKD